MINFKVMELSVVTDDEIEKVLNDMSQKGWFLDGIHFAMRESSKRPSMAFLIFYKVEEEKE